MAAPSNWAAVRSRLARTLLLPVYRLFTEGLETSDLVSAKTVLDSLRP